MNNLQALNFINKPLPIDFYTAGDDEYRVMIDEIMLGWVMLRNGSWTAYPLLANCGETGFESARAAAEWMAAQPEW